MVVTKATTSPESTLLESELEHTRSILDRAHGVIMAIVIELNQPNRMENGQEQQQDDVKKWLISVKEDIISRLNKAMIPNLELNDVSLDDIDSFRELAEKLNGIVEGLAFSWEEDIEGENHVSNKKFDGNISTLASTETTTESTSILLRHLLNIIAQLYKIVAVMKRWDNERDGRNSNGNDNDGDDDDDDDDDDGVMDSYLDWAIASKRAYRWDDCIAAQYQRWEQYDVKTQQKLRRKETNHQQPSTEKTKLRVNNLFMAEAVRLIGWKSKDGHDKKCVTTTDTSENGIAVQEICTTGIFESVKLVKTTTDVANIVSSQSQQENDENHGTERDVPSSSYEVWHPSEAAIDLGVSLRRLFLGRARYTWPRCRQLLWDLILTQNKNDDDDVDGPSNVAQQETTVAPPLPPQLCFVDANVFFRHRRLFWEYYSQHYCFGFKDISPRQRSNEKKNRELKKHVATTTNHGDENDGGMSSNPTTSQDDCFMALAALFLFGIALPKKWILHVLGNEILTLLTTQSKLLFCLPSKLPMTSSQNINDHNHEEELVEADDAWMVGQVQIFPLNSDSFDIPSSCSENDDDDGQIKNENEREEIQCNGKTTADENEEDSYYSCLFMTDWNMESLRLPRDAVMPVGYDTMELLALTASKAAKNNLWYRDGDEIAADNSDDNTSNRNVRVLDLCCGCGIQGLFAAARFKQQKSRQERQQKQRIRCTKSELLCMDINERACHFVTANMCINDLAWSKSEEDGDDDVLDICVIPADLYVPKYQQGNDHNSMKMVETTSEDHHPFPGIGRFDYILTNPPFVAVPKLRNNNSNNACLSPALYSAGGGLDGMDLLRRLLNDCWYVLKDNPTSAAADNTTAATVEDVATTVGNAAIQECDPSSSPLSTSLTPMLLMVTEVPNVEKSCQLLQRMVCDPSSLPKNMLEPVNSSSHSSTDSSPSNPTVESNIRAKPAVALRIRVAYIEEDVETVQEYAREREIEAGCYVESRNWDTSTATEVGFHQKKRKDDDEGGENDQGSKDETMAIYNRALVLISISKQPVGQNSNKNRDTDDDVGGTITVQQTSIGDYETCHSGTACFSSSSSHQTNELEKTRTSSTTSDKQKFFSAINEEEDSFLTEAGIRFARDFLLL